MYLICVEKSIFAQIFRWIACFIAPTVRKILSTAVNETRLQALRISQHFTRSNIIDYLPRKGCAVFNCYIFFKAKKIPPGILCVFPRDFLQHWGK